MKKTLLTIILIVFSILSYGQVGMNTTSPKATLDVMGKAADTNVTDGIIAPRLTGNQLKAKDDLYGTDQTGTIVYATSAASPVSIKTQNVTTVGYYYFDGSAWISLKGTAQPINDAVRYLGGTVYVIVSQQNGGSLDNSRVIGGAENVNYNVGTVTQTSKKGGMNFLTGNGYTISNPVNGIFDIKFDTPLTQIYGISASIVDAYGSTPGAAVSNGQAPSANEPGMNISTINNSQVSYISNSIIRIKTGDKVGTLNNRSFTFLVTGK